MGLEAQIQAMLGGVAASAQEVLLASQHQENPYIALRATFGAIGGSGVPYAPGMGPVDTQGRDYIVNEAGQLLYRSGVIADPNTGDIFMPPPSIGIDSTTVPGSPQWLAAIQKSWDVKKTNQWRKTLFDQGYQVAESGGMGWDLIEALKEYHSRRYLNYGEAVALAPTKGQARDSIRKTLDFKVLKEETKSWGQVPFEEDLDDDTAQYFADRVVDVATRLAQKHPEWSSEQAISGANVRVQNEFIDRPAVKQELDAAQDDEMSTKIRDSIVSVAQLGSI